MATGLSPAVRAIVDAARATVRDRCRGADEVSCATKRPKSPSMMWKLFRFQREGKTFAVVGAFSKHASLFFPRGAELDDPTGLLLGTGKALRYVKLRTEEDASSRALGALVRRAFALASPE